MSSSAIEHASREFHGYLGAQYALPADEGESQRLTIQHNSLKGTFNGRILFPPVTLNRGDKVLDSGTGTGLWLLDLSTTLVDPEVQMLGIDISSRLFPLTHPKNFEFQVQSVLNLPADWSGTFALVHQRLLMMALRISEWPQALREIYRVLRPGGWVQLGEFVPYHDGEHPDKPCHEKVVTMLHRLVKDRSLFLDCVADLPAMLEESGFVEIQSEKEVNRFGLWAGESSVGIVANIVGFFRGIKTPILEAGGYGVVSSESEYDALIAGVEREWTGIGGTKEEFAILWARKPVE